MSSIEGYDPAEWEEFDEEWEDFEEKPERPLMEYCLHCVHPLSKHTDGLRCTICQQQCGRMSELVAKVAKAHNYDVNSCALCNKKDHKGCDRLNMIYCKCHQRQHKVKK